MATFKITNNLGSDFALPNPLNRIIPANSNIVITAPESAVTEFGVLDAMAKGTISIDRVNNLSIPDSVEGLGAFFALGRVESFTLTAGQSMTLTHDLGMKAYGIRVFDQLSGDLAAAADIAVSQADANTLAVSSIAGGTFVLVGEWAAGVEHLGAIAATDVRVVIA